MLLDRPRGFEDARSEKERFLGSLVKALGRECPTCSSTRRPADRPAWFSREGRTARLPCPACTLPVGFPLPAGARMGRVLQGSSPDGALRPLVRVESVEEIRPPVRGSGGSGDQLVDFFPCPAIGLFMAVHLASSLIDEYRRRR